MSEVTGEDLYSMVTKNARNDDNSNLIPKIQFGYTVDNYKGVLEALQQAAKNAISEHSSSQISGSEHNRNVIFARWTEMGSINIKDSGYYPDGFVVTDKDSIDYEKQRQQRVKFMPFMSFVIETEDDKKIKKPHLACFDSSNRFLNNGTCDARGGRVAFPPYVIDGTVCDKIGITVGGMRNPCEIGIAVDLTEGVGTPDSFFSHCYNKIYKAGMSGKLVSRRALMAEVAFGNGGVANTLHARVIANSGRHSEGTFHSIYIPIPILLTEEFDTLADVYIENDQQQKVGVDVTYPFRSSYYNHLDGSLSDFTPQYLKDIVQKQLKVPNCSCSFYTSDANNEKGFGYIRFYIDKEKEAQIKDCLAGEIPDEYRSEIFKGTKEAKMGQKIIGYKNSFDEVDSFWEEIGRILKNPLSGQEILQAINLVAKWESGYDKEKDDDKENGWAAWGICGGGDGDGEGVSVGKFQFTQKAGGIKIYKDKFLKLGGYMSVGFQSAIENAKVGSKVTRAEAAELLEFKREFIEQSSTLEGRLAQCEVWKEQKGKITIDWYNQFDCSTPAEFSSIFGAVNHIPGKIVEYYAKWKSLIQGKPKGIDKVKAIEGAHWAALANYKYGKNVEPDDINASFIRNLSSNFGDGWADRYTYMMNAFKTMC